MTNPNIICNAIGNAAPSDNQRKALEWVVGGTGNAILHAVAGSGKTFTMRLVAQVIAEMNPLARIQVVVFAAKNAREMKGTFPEQAWTGTFHSVWWGAWRKFHSGTELEDNKTWKMFDAVLEDKWCGDDANKSHERGTYGSFVKKLVGYAKAEGVTYLLPATLTTWNSIIDHHGMTLDNEEADYGRAIWYANAALKAGIANKDIFDFDDMLFMPLIYKVSTYRKDWVLVDEAQDTNPVQRALLPRMLKSGGRLMAVGDERQSIFGFRGATSDALQQIKDEFNCTPLPLSVTFRNPKSVVELAQTIVPHIQAADDAEEGVVRSIPVFLPDEIQPEDVILCRNTAPLVTNAYRMIAKGKGCKILGRDIGMGLVKIIIKMKAKGIPALEKKLDAWREREVAKATAKGADAVLEAVNDKFDSLRAVIATLDENARTVPALVAKIENMFTNDVSRTVTTFATIHKSKGLEWDRVYIIRPDLMPSKYARQPWMMVQEENIRYVAITRARQELVFVLEGEAA